MNHKAIRVPSYATYYTRDGIMEIVVELEAKLGSTTECEDTAQMCSEHVAQEIRQLYWHSNNGYFPALFPFFSDNFLLLSK